jgi:hypothetical protein
MTALVRIVVHRCGNTVGQAHGMRKHHRLVPNAKQREAIAGWPGCLGSP